MKSSILAISASLLFCFLGCGGGGGTTGTAGTAGMGGTGGGDATTAAGGLGGTGGAGATGGSAGPGGAAGTGGSMEAPLAPTMKGAEPLEGALHVSWTNNTPDCDKIELDRKKDAEMYALAYTLAGAATSQHDTQATAPGMYCYKSRCIKGMQTSPDS